MFHCIIIATITVDFIQNIFRLTMIDIDLIFYHDNAKKIK